MKQLNDKQKQAIINTLDCKEGSQQDMVDAFSRMLSQATSVSLHNQLTRYVQKRNKRKNSDKCKGLYVCDTPLGRGQLAVNRAARIERVVNDHLGNQEWFCDSCEIDAP